MLELTPYQWSIAALVAFLIGFSKTGLPGGGILAAPLLAMIMPAKASTGFLLPILALADIMAIVYWKRHVDWGQLKTLLLPWTLIGVVIGFLLMRPISGEQLKPIIGLIVFVLVTGSWIRDRYVQDEAIPTHPAFAATMGLLAGALSMMANAAGPVMIIYLLALRFDKKKFIGTQAWFFWILNLSKMPFSLAQDLITGPSLLANLALIPAIVIGGLLGITLVHRISQKSFKGTVRLLALVAAIKLCQGWWGLWL